MKLSREERDEQLWGVARKLGYSRDELDAMLEKSTPTKVLQKLTSKHAQHTRRLERESQKAWLDMRADKRREVYEQERALIDAARKQHRAQRPLPERVSVVLAEASLAQEQTTAAGYEPRVAGDNDGVIPRLHGRPLAEEIRDLLEAVVERAERELDRVVRSLPSETWEDRNAQILNCSGTPELVAIRFGVSESHVRKLRNSKGLRSADGTPQRQAA